MKNIYLLLAIAGFIAPNILVALESWETGNILLYADPIATMEGMFANRVATIFMIDLFFAVLVFFLWSYVDAKKNGVKSIYGIWLLTLLFGLAGGFPFYLYQREKAKAQGPE